jgi:hypothetical protein
VVRVVGAEIRVAAVDREIARSGGEVARARVRIAEQIEWGVDVRPEDSPPPNPCAPSPR